MVITEKIDSSKLSIEGKFDKWCIKKFRNILTLIHYVIYKLKNNLPSQLWKKAIASPTLVYCQLWLKFSLGWAWLWLHHKFEKKNTDHINKGFSLSLKFEPCRGIPWRTSSSSLNFQPCRGRIPWRTSSSSLNFQTRRGMTSKEEKNHVSNPRRSLRKKGIGRLKFCN